MAQPCPCACHNCSRGDYNEAAHHQNYAAILIFSRVETVNVNVSVETSDPLEAAVACSACQDRHCPALLTRYVPDPTVWVDTAHPPPAEAAGGTDDDD